MVTIALVIITTAVALILAWLYHLVVAAVVVTILVDVPSLYLLYVPIWESRAASGPVDLADIADEFANAISEQWEKEAAVRGLNDPWPLPVSWVGADTSLADSWHLLVTLATNGAGWPSPPSVGDWAAEPDELGGDGNNLLNVLGRVPTRRLVVLGAPGAGKTTLMVRLVLDLLVRRASGDPVPVLVSLASWNPADQDLHAWLTTQLTADHPALEAAVPGIGKNTRLGALLRAKLILPVLDGLDEIPTEVRGSAIGRINETLRPGEQLIVTCRTEQFEEAVRPPGGAVITVRGAAVVQLRPLTADAVSRYLRDAAGGQGSSERWDPVLALLGSEAPVGQALVTPLMVSLASTIYNPRLGERADQLPDPAQLCKLSDRGAVEAQLFDGFIPAAYRIRPGRWGARRARRWLAFLANHLQNNPDLAWWQIARAAPTTDAAVALGGISGLSAGLAVGLTSGVWAGVVVGVFCFIAAGSMGRLIYGRRAKPSRGMRISAPGFQIGLMLGLMVGVVAWLANGFRDGLLAGLAGFGMGLLAGGASAMPGDLAEAASPMTVLKHDRRAALELAGVIAFAMVVAAGMVSGLTTHIGFGLGFGLLSGLLISVEQTAWPSYALARASLAWHRKLPWSLMAFLADAHDREILRQVGSVYQFRHIDLQRHLADRPNQ
jgi:NACHT domain